MGKYLDDAGLAELTSKIKQWGAKKAISGAGEPSSSTAGEVGQVYIDTATRISYVCTMVSGGSYLWQKLISSFDASTWKGIQTITRMGFAPSLLNIGDTYSFVRNGTTINCKVMDFITGGTSGAIKIKNTNLTNGVIFQTVDCLYQLQFDEREAFYYTPTGLNAGDYCFTVGQDTWASGDVGKTFYFTLTNALPAGGQLVFVRGYNVSCEGTEINVFASPTTYVTTETPTMSSTAIAGATNLGTLNNSLSGNFNSNQRAVLGNNRWKESALRQHLNSDAVAGVWTPQNNWDRPPAWRATTAGFMNGLSTDFTDCVAELEVQTNKNAVCDGGGYETTDEKFFLPSCRELWMPGEEGDNGVEWSYYREGSSSQTPTWDADAIRIKALNGTATYWWNRSPQVGIANNVRLLYPTGASSYATASYTYGVAPAFVIA